MSHDQLPEWATSISSPLVGKGDATGTAWEVWGALRGVALGWTENNFIFINPKGYQNKPKVWLL